MSQKIRHLLQITIIVIVGFMVSDPANAGRYIVSSIATSTNWSAAEWTNYPNTPSCTPVTPQTAFARAQAGDTVYFRGGAGGNYNVSPTNYLTPALNPSNSGTAGSPITFTNYPGETPIIVNANHNCTSIYDDGCIGPVMGSHNKDYIVLDGFQFGNTQSWDNEGYTLVRFTGSKYCTIQNCVFKSLTNFVSKNAWSYSNPTMIGLYGNDGVTQTDTLISNCFLTGGADNDRFNAIISYDATRVTIQYTTIESSRGGICLKDGGIDWTIRYNFIRNMADAYPLIKAGADGAGVRFRNLKAYQNVILLSSSNWGAFGTWNYGDTANIYNNTIYGANGTYNGIWATSETAGNTNISFFNNVVARAGKFYYFKSGESPLLADYNIYDNRTPFSATSNGTTHNWSNWRGTAGYDAHSYNEAVTWANAGGTTAADYKCISSHKFNGRGGPYASVIGAYITGNETIGYSGTSPFSPSPAPPSDGSIQPPVGLRVLQ